MPVILSATLAFFLGYLFFKPQKGSPSFLKGFLKDFTLDNLVLKKFCGMSEEEFQKINESSKDGEQQHSGLIKFLSSFCTNLKETYGIESMRKSFKKLTDTEGSGEIKKKLTVYYIAKILMLSTSFASIYLLQLFIGALGQGNTHYAIKLAFSMLFLGWFKSTADAALRYRRNSTTTAWLKLLQEKNVLESPEPTIQAINESDSCKHSNTAALVTDDSKAIIVSTANILEKIISATVQIFIWGWCLVHAGSAYLLLALFVLYLMKPLFLNRLRHYGNVIQKVLKDRTTDLRHLIGLKEEIGQHRNDINKKIDDNASLNQCRFLIDGMFYGASQLIDMGIKYLVLSLFYIPLVRLGIIGLAVFKSLTSYAKRLSKAFDTGTSVNGEVKNLESSTIRTAAVNEAISKDTQKSQSGKVKTSADREIESRPATEGIDGFFVSPLKARICRWIEYPFVDKLNDDEINEIKGLHDDNASADQLEAHFKTHKEKGYTKSAFQQAILHVENTQSQTNMNAALEKVYPHVNIINETLGLHTLLKNYSTIQCLPNERIKLFLVLYLVLQISMVVLAFNNTALMQPLLSAMIANNGPLINKFLWDMIKFDLYFNLLRATLRTLKRYIANRWILGLQKHIIKQVNIQECMNADEQFNAKTVDETKNLVDTTCQLSTDLLVNACNLVIYSQMILSLGGATYLGAAIAVIVLKSVTLALLNHFSIAASSRQKGDEVTSRNSFEALFKRFNESNRKNTQEAVNQFSTNSNNASLIDSAYRGISAGFDAFFWLCFNLCFVYQTTAGLMSIPLVIQLNEALNMVIQAINLPFTANSKLRSCNVAAGRVPQEVFNEQTAQQMPTNCGATNVKTIKN